jgi:hypothetical protein
MTDAKALPLVRKNVALRKRRITVGATLVTLIIGGTAAFTALVWPGFAQSAPVVSAMPVLPLTSQPGLDPHPRVGEQTALVAAIPDFAGNWVQSGISGFFGWQHSADAVEAWTVVYQRASGNNTESISLVAGQWTTNSAASAFYRTNTTGVPGVIESGSVMSASGTVVGSYQLSDGKHDPAVAESEAGQVGIMWWRNANVVVKAIGPIELLRAFYSQFPL